MNVNVGGTWGLESLRKSNVLTIPGRSLKIILLEQRLSLIFEVKIRTQYFIVNLSHPFKLTNGKMRILDVF